MYLTAAMTGMRQGELFALRWRDVDWSARRIRVRRNYVRGEFGTPKSKRSARSVPLASRVATELELLFQDSQYKKDDDLVFAHPETGKPIDRSKRSWRRVPTGRPRWTSRLSPHACLEIREAPDGQLSIAGRKLVGVLLEDVKQNHGKSRPPIEDPIP
jgi:integrase